MIFGFFLHIAISTLLALLWTWSHGHLTSNIAGWSLFIGALLGWQWSSKSPSLLAAMSVSWQPKSWREGFEIALAVFFIWVCFQHFLHLFFWRDQGFYTLDINNFGDLPLHINYIRQFALGASFPFVNPAVAGEWLRYPYGIDFYNALWEAVGVPLASHLFWVGTICSFALIVTLRKWAGSLGLIGFFLGGGWAGWQILFGHAFESEDKLAWKNLFLTVWMTQRGFLFALPVGLFLLWTIRNVLRGHSVLLRRETRALALLWGSLGLFHLHTLVIVSLFLISLGWIYRRKMLVFGLGLRAFPLAMIFVLFSTDYFARAGVTHWRRGWMQTADESFLTFASYNWGPYLILLLGLALASVFIKNRGLRPEFWLYLSAMILFLNLMLAPWEWDNIKILLWCYLGLLALANEFVFSKLPGTVFAVSVVVLSLSGFTRIIPSLSIPQATRIYGTEDLANAEGALRDIPRDAVFIAARTHHHALTYLGRPRALGFEGQIWSHGINSSERVESLARLISGAEDMKSAAQALHATHIFWGPDEVREYGPVDWSARGLKNISLVPGYAVYEL